MEIIDQAIFLLINLAGHSGLVINVISSDIFSWNKKGTKLIWASTQACSLGIHKGLKRGRFARV